MVTAPNRSVMRWLFAFCGVVAVLIVFGGFVRLTRSGLSITEWDPATGIIPPIGDRAWHEAFTRYRASPEYLKVNSSMTLDEFRRIFLIEWLHRLVARLAGLAFAIPLAVFLARRRIPRRDLGPYLVMGMLFVLQAIAGWLMVASGLEDRPSVSHYNLTVHLLLAFTLLALALWAALDHQAGGARPPVGRPWTRSSKAAAGFLTVVVLQIAYGGMTAGLKAGYVSNTWPLMLGRLVPANLLDSPLDLVESPTTIAFVHRWFAFAVLTAAAALALATRPRWSDPTVRRAAAGLVAAVCLQVALGITTVLTSVKSTVALSHQAGAIVVFAAGLALLHRLRALDAPPG